MSKSSDSKVLLQIIEEFKDIPTEKIIQKLKSKTVSKLDKRIYNEILKQRGVKKLF